MRYLLIAALFPYLAQAADCSYQAQTKEKARAVKACFLFAQPSPFSILGCGPQLRVANGDRVLLRKPLGDGNVRSARWYAAAGCPNLALVSYGDEGGTWGTVLIRLDAKPKLLGEVKNLDTAHEEQSLLDLVSISGTPTNPSLRFDGELGVVGPDGNFKAAKTPAIYRYNGTSLVKLQP